MVSWLYVCVCVCVPVLLTFPSRHTRLFCEDRLLHVCRLLCDHSGVHKVIFAKVFVVATVATFSLSLSFNRQKCDSSIIVPPLSFGKDNLYHPVFIIPDQMEQCVFATEVRTRLLKVSLKDPLNYIHVLFEQSCSLITQPFVYIKYNNIK